MEPDDFKQSNITRKLAEISELMGDGYIFLKMRMSAENWEKEPDNLASAQLITTIEQFHKICIAMKKDSK